MDGVVKLSTRLEDCKVGYGRKTESGRSKVIQKYKCCIIPRRWRHLATECHVPEGVEARRMRRGVH